MRKPIEKVDVSSSKVLSYWILLKIEFESIFKSFPALAILLMWLIIAFSECVIRHPFGY